MVTEVRWGIAMKQVLCVGRWMVSVILLGWAFGCDSKSGSGSVIPEDADTALTDWVSDGSPGGEDSNVDVDVDIRLEEVLPAPFDPAAVQVPFCPVDEATIDQVYQGLSARQRIGQHLSIHINRSGQGVHPDSEARMRSFLPGAVSVAQISGVAAGDPAKTARFLHHAQSIAVELSGVPLFISSDQEGGVYTSVNGAMGGTDSIGPTAIGATGDEWVAFHQFDMMGREVKAVGINTNFGPLLDTHYQQDSGNLNTRTFGPDVELNSRLGVAAVLGFQRNLVLAMAKHFPGDGMTANNTHHEFTYNTATVEELELRLLKPFRSAFAAGCDAVMMIPAQFAALDDQRAAITSRPIIMGFLRGQLGFAGLVFSDDLGMLGARLGLSEGQVLGVEAIKAGTDILLTGDQDVSAIIEGIEKELDSGGISALEFEESTKRILRYKQKYCLLQNPTYPDQAGIDTISERIGRPEDAAMSATHAERALVLLKDSGQLPVGGKRILCVGPHMALPDPASGWNWLLQESFCMAMQQEDPSVEALDFIVSGSESSVQKWVEDRADGADVIVVATFQSYFGPAQQTMLDWLLDSSGLPVIHVAQGVAFDAIQTMGRASAVLALQGSLPVMLRAAVRVLYGEATPQGRMLYDLASPR